MATASNVIFYFILKNFDSVLVSLDSNLSIPIYENLWYSTSYFKDIIKSLNVSFSSLDSSKLAYGDWLENTFSLDSFWYKQRIVPSSKLLESWVFHKFLNHCFPPDEYSDMKTYYPIGKIFPPIYESPLRGFPHWFFQ